MQKDVQELVNAITNSLCETGDYIVDEELFPTPADFDASLVVLSDPDRITMVQGAGEEANAEFDRRLHEDNSYVILIQKIPTVKATALIKTGKIKPKL